MAVSNNFLVFPSVQKGQHPPVCPGPCPTIQRIAWPLCLERKLQFLKVHLRKELATHSAIMGARSLLSSLSNSTGFSEEMTITKQNGWEYILPNYMHPAASITSLTCHWWLPSCHCPYVLKTINATLRFIWISYLFRSFSNRQKKRVWILNVH